MDNLVERWIKLDDEGKYLEAYDLILNAIENQESKNVDLYWRLAKSCRDLALSTGKKEKNIYKQYVAQGLKFTEEGLKIDSENGKCNSWYAIFLNYSAELEGINKRIEYSYKMKEHWLKALKADPNDYVTMHALGRWCYEVADLPWIKQKLAATFFSAPPTSSYDEALKYLLKSEELKPKSIPYNCLYLARTYHRLHQNDHAKEFCDKVLEFTTDDLETETAKKEVRDLLKKL